MNVSFSIEQAISNAVRVRLAEIVAEEGERAADRVRQRVGEEVDSLALSVMSEYRLHERETGLVIEVRKRALHPTVDPPAPSP
jgi:hypothetical protein